MSALALWFFIGSIVAIMVLITDFCIDRKNKLALFRDYGSGIDTTTVEDFCKIYYPVECTMWVILGPASIYFYWKRTKLLRKETAKLTA